MEAAAEPRCFTSPRRYQLRLTMFSMIACLHCPEKLTLILQQHWFVMVYSLKKRYHETSHDVDRGMTSASNWSRVNLTLREGSMSNLLPLFRHETLLSLLHPRDGGSMQQLEIRCSTVGSGRPQQDVTLRSRAASSQVVAPWLLSLATSPQRHILTSAVGQTSPRTNCRPVS